MPLFVMRGHIYIIIDIVLYKFRMQPMLKNSVLLLKRAQTLLFNLDTPSHYLI